MARTIATKNVTIQNHTTVHPVTLIGEEAGICWGIDTSDAYKNYKRGIRCIKSNHGRTMEFPQIYLTIEGYSARCIRELYTHIAGGPTRLQESTRYIGYDTFEYITPKSITESNNDELKHAYHYIMDTIALWHSKLLDLAVPKEDAANVLPLGMTTKIVMRTNLRHLVDIMAVRQCNRAYWEMRELMTDIKKALSEYSSEWKEVVETYMPVKCVRDCKCTEEHSCGWYTNTNRYTNERRIPE